MIWMIIWYWLLVVFSAADIVITNVALSIGTPYYESNFLIVPIVDHLVELKILVVIVVVAIAIGVEIMNEESGWVPISFASCCTFLIVMANFARILS
jgi:hypothetical protein